MGIGGRAQRTVLLGPGLGYLALFLLVPCGIVFVYSFFERGTYGGIDAIFTWEVVWGQDAFGVVQNSEYTFSFWMASAHPDSPAQLAAHLEITSPLVRNYFDNLLPDNPRIRERTKAAARRRVVAVRRRRDDARDVPRRIAHLELRRRVRRGCGGREREDRDGEQESASAH